MHHSLITSGGATASLADAKQLLTASVTIPTKEGSIHVILRMLALYQVVLPPGHPITSFMSVHYFAMKNFDPDLASYHTSNPGQAGLEGVYHLAWIMDHLTIYFQATCTVSGPHGNHRPHQASQSVGTCHLSHLLYQV